ncbi:hypothetical protein ZN41_003701 [Salmonella enterica subsp. enterica]|nr:hypothetical protein [Salmonella enterica subsp. enterica]
MKWLFISVLTFLAAGITIFAVLEGEFIGGPLITLILTMAFIFDLLFGR